MDTGYGNCPARKIYLCFGVLSHIINPLLTKLVRSRWLDIGLVLFVSVHKYTGEGGTLQLNISKLSAFNFCKHLEGNIIPTYFRINFYAAEIGMIAYGKPIRDSSLYSPEVK